MDRRTKKYIPVVVRFETDGRLRPLVVDFDEAHKYQVDKVLDVRRAACQREAGVGDRYTCQTHTRRILSTMALEGVAVSCRF